MSADRLYDSSGMLGITFEWQMEQLEGNLKWRDQWDVSYKQHSVYCHGQAKKLQHLICKNFTVWLDNESNLQSYRRLHEQYN
jgi:hypothetical protein